jgi:hypothetical protein
VRRALAALAMAGALPCAAQVFEAPMRDPWVPPALRAKARVEAASQGEALQAQVDTKLREAFAKAAPGGTLTREQAGAAGLGFVARHFDAMDRERRGIVRVEDYLRFLREQRAAGG